VAAVVQALFVWTTSFGENAATSSPQYIVLISGCTRSYSSPVGATTRRINP
jgi:hypothetical protein